MWLPKYCSNQSTFYMKFSLTTLFLVISLAAIAVVYFNPSPKHDRLHFLKVYCDGMEPSGAVTRLYDEQTFGGESPQIAYDNWNRSDKKVLMPDRLSRLLDSCVDELHTTGVTNGMSLEQWQSTILAAKLEVFRDYLAVPPFNSSGTSEVELTDRATGHNRQLRRCVIGEVTRCINAFGDATVSYPRTLDEIPNAIGEHTFFSHLRIQFFTKIKYNFTQSGYPIPAGLDLALSNAIAEPTARFE